MTTKNNSNIDSSRKDYIFLRIISLSLLVFEPLISLDIKLSNTTTSFNLTDSLVYFMAFLCLFISTFTNKFVRKNASSITNIIYFLLTAILLYYCYLYDFPELYGWLILIGISAVTLIIRKLIYLVIYLATVLLSSISLVFLIANPGVSRLGFSLAVVMLCFISYISIRAKFTDQLTIEQSAEQIENIAYYDVLTGLPNRYSLINSMEEILSKSAKTNQNFAVMFIDLDNFKNVNDLFGHNLGDMLLQQVANRLLSCISTYGSVFRYGGDEFIILLDNTSKKQCAFLAWNIIDEFSHPFQLSTTEIYSSPSIGISMYPEHGQDAETLIKNSDNAMYSAKRKSKNNFKFFNEGLSKTLSRKIELENGLRKALQNNEFILYYQPLVELNTSKIYGLEALLRWSHPTLGMVSPAEFIPLAEDSGLIVPIGEWVLETACKQNQIWQKSGIANIDISINVSGYQLKHSDFCKTVREKLIKTNLPAENLIVEITESIMQDSVSASQIVDELKKYGVKVALDDFGTGYSSLGLLKNLHINILKIDSSFMKDVRENTNTLAILELIINMGNRLGFQIIIEGIETEFQANLLKQNNCKFGQGYLFSRPLPASEIEELIRDNYILNNHNQMPVVNL